MKKIIVKIICIYIVSAALVGCVSKKDLMYFQDAQTNTTSETTMEPLHIEVNDILSIKISAADPITALPYNPSSSSGVAINNLEVMKLQGYLVSEEGMVTIPVLGKVSVVGKTLGILEQEIVEKLESGGHLISPTVSVRLLNPKITVLGEVKAPGTYTYTEQQVSLPQALGYAGDLTINGRREDVMLIREEQGKRTVVKIDMTATDFFTSPYYYVRQNDIIYVSPNKAKVFSSTVVGSVATVLSAASVILSAVVLITNN
ncbi:polysaccharide export outer membrane protein [Pustulibacterium marinum]|uniref:Polysaccharide export outer membrane protein n=1 Tax=Pustulibacterium marinum TaxID=1224947 RepID=A0A1I7F2D9_9FLAO|nr:polysaccharide biosynthesis/export family protein [Pustulibacterium marinum]SFU30285.1 polysaccharide export outer membrane protein [Pustulibacterium marinum]